MNPSSLYNLLYRFLCINYLTVCEDGYCGVSNYTSSVCCPTSSQVKIRSVLYPNGSTVTKSPVWRRRPDLRIKWGMAPPYSKNLSITVGAKKLSDPILILCSASESDVL
eukprot:sb/3477476/